jgi:predicted phosphodiesterase
MQSDVLVMDGTVLLFGGPYGNLQATEALLEETARLCVPPGRVVCTGDVVAYCGDPSATVDAVRAAGIRVVMGNCEESLGQAASDCACGFAVGSACERMAVEWYAHANRSLGESGRAWMRALPRRLDIVVGARRLAVVHGSVGRINRFVFASTPAAEKRAAIDLAEADGVIGGHCGLPFTQAIGGRLWHNPGAIGLPANDGTPRAWFSLLTPEPGGIRIEHRALDYDHRAAAAAMRASGLAGGYADALETGLWPSCDVLPDAEIAARGKPLAPGTVWWPDHPNGPAAWP